jgi:hypothetical protein
LRIPLAGPLFALEPTATLPTASWNVKFMSDGPPKAEVDPLHTDDETEQLALAAADAIKRLIAERAALRSLVTTQERELIRLRDHVTLIRNSYRRLANELITQLQLIDNIDGEVAEKPAGPAELHWLRDKQQNQPDI